MTTYDDKYQVNIGSCNGLLPDGTKPFHDQCWLITTEVLQNSPESNFIWSNHDIYPSYMISIHHTSIHSGHYTSSINCCKKKHSVATITQLRSLEFVYTFRSFYCIYQLLQKHSIATITLLRSLELLTIKTPLLHILYYMNWLTQDFWTGTGGWEFDRSHGTDTSSPSHWNQVEEQAPKPVGWMMCFLFVPVLKLCVYIYIYICNFYNSIWDLFSWFTNCVLLSDDNILIPGCLWVLAFVLSDTLILGIWFKN